MLGQTLGNSGVFGAASLSSGDTAASPVGAYTITAALGTLAAQNYTFSFASSTLSVMPATLTVTANPASRTYGAADPTYTASYSGFVLGQILGDSGVNEAPNLSSTDTTAPGGELHDHRSAGEPGCGELHLQPGQRHAERHAGTDHHSAGRLCGVHYLRAVGNAYRRGYRGERCADEHGNLPGRHQHFGHGDTEQWNRSNYREFIACGC